MLQLQPWFNQFDRFWVTFPGEDTKSLLRGEQVYYAHEPETRNFWNAFKNAILAFTVLRKERPDVLVSCGAGIAPPFFYIGKLLGIRLIFVEPFDRIASPTLSGKLVSPITDEFYVQHKSQLMFFPRAQYKGALL